MLRRDTSPDLIHAKGIAFQLTTVNKELVLQVIRPTPSSVRLPADLPDVFFISFSRIIDHIKSTDACRLDMLGWQHLSDEEMQNLMRDAITEFCDKRTRYLFYQFIDSNATEEEDNFVIPIRITGGKTCGLVFKHNKQGQYVKAVTVLPPSYLMKRIHPGLTLEQAWRMENEKLPCIFYLTDSKSFLCRQNPNGTSAIIRP